MRGSRNTTFAVATVMVLALVAGFFGGSTLATQDRVLQRYRVFGAALAAIQGNYIGEVEPDRLVYRAIGGMLQTLDPHSSFMDPRSYAQLRERQEGRYHGLGISISVIDGNITVMSLFEDSPAYRTGIRRGDIIAKIDGTDAKGMNSDQAVRRLRGPRGTSVNIAIRRMGYDALIDLEVERDEIKIPTIQGAFMVDAIKGYIRLSDFSETSDQDLRRALRELSSLGMEQLLLDLRGNPGGPLDQAIRVSNEFLPRGDMIVYTRGRVRNSDQDYHATELSEFTQLPLVVLVDRNSASASEIVAGAIQDHDRGLIVGEMTFGKALVQSIYSVSEGAGLALTTARYYTPSGRLIQRPWDGAFDEYLTYSMRDQEPRPRTSVDPKYTDAGREVFSGGGIEPDRFMAGPYEGFAPERLGRLLVARGAFAGYAQKFTVEGDTRIGGVAKPKHRKTVESGFTVDEVMIEDFKGYLRDERVVVEEDAFTGDSDFIRAMIHYEIDLALFSVEEARRNLLSMDPQAQYALSLFGEAEELLELGQSSPSIEIAR